MLLAGIMAPPNMGAEYAERFNPIYKRLADKYNLMLYPFFLEGVVLDASLQLEDGMHPNTAGVDVMVKNALPLVKDFIKTIGGQ
ncbi:Acyl-CoA thioesterase I precursor [compost metagenome]